MKPSQNKDKRSPIRETKPPIVDAASRYAALRSHAIRLEEAIDPNAERVDKVGKMDVIFGRGKGLQKHPGNKRMRSIIDRYKVEYHAAKRAEKKDLVVQVYNEIVEGGVRFLKKLDDENTWIVVDEPVAMEKVSHTLRCRRLLKGSAKEKEADAPPRKDAKQPPAPSSKVARLPSSANKAGLSSSSVASGTAALPQPGALPLSSIQGAANPYLAASLYGNLGGSALSASALGSFGGLGALGAGSTLSDLQALSSFSGLGGGYDGLWNASPMLSSTDMEYLALLRRQQLQQSLLMPQSREAAMLQSARLRYLAADDTAESLASEHNALQLSGGGGSNRDLDSSGSSSGTNGG